MIGNKYGEWTVLGPSEITRRVWCRCSCGYECAVRKHDLKRGSSTKCKACASLQNGEKNNNWKGVGDVGSTYFSRIKKGAIRRGHEITITLTEISELYDKQEGKCALTGLPISIKRVGGDASLDRIDSSKGYIKGNVQWVDKRVNNMKQALPEGEFIEMCRLVFLHNKENRSGNFYRDSMFPDRPSTGSEVSNPSNCDGNETKGGS